MLVMYIESLHWFLKVTFWLLYSALGLFFCRRREETIGAMDAEY